MAHVPVSVAVLDERGLVRVLNPASKQDALLAQVPVGGTVLDGAYASLDLRALAEARQRYFQQSLEAQRPLVFDDEHSHLPSFQWLCLPVEEEDGPYLVVVGSARGHHEPPLGAQRTSAAELLRTLHDELRAPRASMVAMAATLSSETNGANSDRARLISHTGRQVLHRLASLWQVSEAP